MAGKPVLDDPEWFGGFNAQDSVLQGPVRSDGRQDLPLGLWATIGEALPGCRGDLKHLRSLLKAARGAFAVVAEHHMESGFLLQQVGSLAGVFLVRQ